MERIYKLMAFLPFSIAIAFSVQGQMATLQSDDVSSTLDTLLVYKSVDGLDLSMSVFLPEGYNESNKSYPTLIFFHGGSWRVGEPSWHYPDCAYWSSRGMVAISVDYRLEDRDNVEVPLACVKDAKSSIRFLRKHAEIFKIDPNKIVAAGASAGGQLAAATAVLTKEDTNDSMDDLSISCVPNVLVLQNPYFKTTADLSPPNFIKEGWPPTATFTGDNDPTVSWKSILDFHKALKMSSNVSSLFIGKGGKHGFCNGRNSQNPYFYWHIELADQFLVQNGILEGQSSVAVPDGVQALTSEDYDVFQ